MAQMQLVPKMTISDDDWSHAGVTYLLREAGYTNSAALHAANEHIQIIKKLVREEPLLVGWFFNGDDGLFAGPARNEALAKVMEIVTEAMDQLLKDI